MKILILGGKKCKYPFFPYQCKKAFETLGHEVVCFNYRYMQLQRIAITNKVFHKMLFRKILDYKPDILLVIKGDSLLPGFINKLKNTGIRTVNWVLDDPLGKYYPENKVKNIQEYDVFFVFDPAYVKKIREINPNTYYLPCAADPTNVHKEVISLPERKYKYDVSFVGSHQPEREKFFKKLTKYDLHIWGYRWNKVRDLDLCKYIHSEVPTGREMCKIFNNSKINLNFHAKHSIEGLNLRTFEVPATKSFILTDYYRELDSLFEVGEEINFYEDIEDLKEKIDYYLSHKKEREKVVKAGYKRILEEHTIVHRVRKILRTLN